jgi:hypothetical protein
MSPKPPKPASPSQVSYTKHLIDQAVSGVKGVPGWLSKDEAPSEKQLADMDADAISALIDSLKARKPFEVERFGNGSYRVHRKSSLMTPSISRVAYMALARQAVRGVLAGRLPSGPGAEEAKKMLDMMLQDAPVGHVFSAKDVHKNVGGKWIEIFQSLGSTFGDKVLLRTDEPGKYMIAKAKRH